MKSLSIEVTLMTTVIVFMSSCAPPQPTKIVPAEFKAGQNYYHRVCANCHGTDALGKQTRAPGLIDPEYFSENFSDEEMGPMVGSFCPNILFPYAREVVSDLVAKGGFPQLLLAPVNFDALYSQHLQQAQQASAKLN